MFLKERLFSPQRRKGAKVAKKVPSKDILDELSHKVIGACIEVHRLLGPGLLESIYVDCLESELSELEIPVKREVIIPVRYKGKELSKPLRLDLLVGDCLIVEVKSVDTLLPVHAAQLLTYLKMTEFKLGLLLNFNVVVMRDGIKRIVNGL
jgi:GxxExxY protein